MAYSGPTARCRRHIVRDPSRETLLADLTGHQPDDHRRVLARGDIEIEAVGTEKHDDRPKSHSLVAVHERMIAHAAAYAPKAGAVQQTVISNSGDLLQLL
jgi:hypothetical protein